MEYCVSAAATSKLVEEFWQIVEGFVECPTNLQAKSMICGTNVSEHGVLFLQVS